MKNTKETNEISRLIEMDTYWYDPVMGNIWNKKYYSKDSAEKASRTLVECYNCEDCTHCENCSQLVSSNYCHNVHFSKYCLHCDNAKHIEHCEFCSNIEFVCCQNKNHK